MNIAIIKSVRKQLSSGVSDIYRGISKYDLALTLSIQDLRQSYRRSKIGPFWITIGMGVMVGTIGTVFGFIFGTPMEDFLPFLTVSLLVWTLISNSLNESSATFTSAEAMIRQLNFPLYVHVLRLLVRNMITFGHNLIILPLVFLVFLRIPGFELIAAVPGLALVALNLAWMTLLVGMFAARFRDAGPIITNLLQVMFYLTPIIWQPKSLPPMAAHYLLGFNPLYHLIQIVRQPVLGEWPTIENWVASIGMMLFGWLATAVIFGRFSRRIAYWV